MLFGLYYQQTWFNRFTYRPTLLGVQISVFTGQEKEVLQYKKQRIYTATYFYWLNLTILIGCEFVWNIRSHNLSNTKNKHLIVNLNIDKNVLIHISHVKISNVLVWGSQNVNCYMQRDPLRCCSRKQKCLTIIFLTIL